MAGDFDIGPADYYADNGESMSNGKGDTPRPMSVDAETYGKRWAETFASPCGAFDRVGSLVTCDTLGPGGSCLACGKGLEHIAEPIHYIDRSEDVFRVPITLRRPLETLGDPEE